MSGSRLDEPRFHALACLLATKEHQQAPSHPGSKKSCHAPSASNSGLSQSGFDDSDAEESDDDGATFAPRELVKNKGIKRLKEKFLDRLAEVLSYRKAWSRVQVTQKNRIGKAARSKKSKSVVSLKDGAQNVAAAGMVETQRQTTIYVAKNGGLDDNDKKIMRQLQIWKGL
ncbi:MAG: hypothetical protein M1836_007618 [Candelina mexicana]|nr:MAG: hypothetical protein M1836_007618 [Candelina mexicana]